MSFSHREEKRGERLLDVLTDETTGIRIVVSRLGAELISLARRDASGRWVGFLYRDDDLDRAGERLGESRDGDGLFPPSAEGRAQRLSRAADRRRNAQLSAHERVASAMKSRGRGEARLTGSTGGDFTPTEYPLDVSLALIVRTRRRRACA